MKTSPPPGSLPKMDASDLTYQINKHGLPLIEQFCKMEIICPDFDVRDVNLVGVRGTNNIAKDSYFSSSISFLLLQLY
jgi:hypothetical protein